MEEKRKYCNGLHNIYKKKVIIFQLDEDKFKSYERILFIYTPKLFHPGNNWNWFLPTPGGKKEGKSNRVRKVLPPRSRPKQQHTAQEITAMLIVKEILLHNIKQPR